MKRTAADIESQRAIRILAKSMVRDLQEQGFEPLHIVRFTTELIEALSEEEGLSPDDSE